MKFSTSHPATRLIADLVSQYDVEFFIRSTSFTVGEIGSAILRLSEEDRKIIQQLKPEHMANLRPLQTQFIPKTGNRYRVK